MEEEKERREPPIPPELFALWQAVLIQMKQDSEVISPGMYDNWLAPLRVVGAEGQVLYLQASSTVDAEQFMRRFSIKASAILSRMVREEVEVRCLPPRARSSA